MRIPKLPALLATLVISSLIFSGCINNGSGKLVGTTTGSISGVITDAKTGAALGSVEVRISGRTNISSSTGAWFISELETGTHAITATRDGYQPYTGQVVVVQGSSVHNFSMSPTTGDSGDEAPDSPPSSLPTPDVTFTPIEHPAVGLGIRTIVVLPDVAPPKKGFYGYTVEMLIPPDDTYQYVGGGNHEHTTIVAKVPDAAYGKSVLMRVYAVWREDGSKEIRSQPTNPVSIVIPEKTS